MGAARVNIIGRVFSRLRVLEVLPTECGEPTRCRVLCTCGQVCLVRRDHLVSGRTQSCGCLLRLDFRDRQVGYLRVLRPGPHARDHSGRSVTQWICHCTRCGREVTVPTAALARWRSSPNASCGCLRLLPTVAPEASAAALPVDPPEKTTSSAEWLRRVHDALSPLGRVRRVAWPLEDEEPAVLHDFDPFTFNNH